MQQQSVQKQPKKAYVTPRLSTHGDVAKLTQFTRPGAIVGSDIIILPRG